MLDAHIRSRIQNELEHLRQEEENVRQEIEQALEKENLDGEKIMAGEASEGDGSAIGGVKSGAALTGDLEEIRKKVDRFHSRRDLSDFPGLKANGEDVTSCYR
jgi:altered-inheritance-of-mitochondria protein 13